MIFIFAYLISLLRKIEKVNAIILDYVYANEKIFDPIIPCNIEVYISIKYFVLLSENYVVCVTLSTQT